MPRVAARSPAISNPIERSRVIRALEALPSRTPGQERLLAWAQREEGYARNREGFFAKAHAGDRPLSPVGSGPGSWVRGASAAFDAWAAWRQSAAGKELFAAPEQRRVYKQRAETGSVLATWGRKQTTAGGIRRTTFAGYRSVSMPGAEASVQPEQIEAWIGTADTAFRGAVTASMDKHGAEWAYYIWRLWPIQTGFSRAGLALFWAMRGGDLVLRFSSAADYTLVGHTAPTWGKARSGMRIALGLVADDLAVSRRAA